MLAPESDAFRRMSSFLTEHLGRRWTSSQMGDSGPSDMARLGG
jgi:hypothetical protein